MSHCNLVDIVDYLDGELPPNKEKAVITHLEECEECDFVMSDIKAFRAFAALIGLSFEGPINST